MKLVYSTDHLITEDPIQGNMKNRIKNYSTRSSKFSHPRFSAYKMSNLSKNSPHRNSGFKFMPKSPEKSPLKSPRKFYNEENLIEDQKKNTLLLFILFINFHF